MSLRCTFRVLMLVGIASLSACQSLPRADRPRPLSDNTPEPVAAQPIDEAISRGVQFLLKTQNPDGSWGTGLQTRGTEIYHSVPGSHDAYRVATSALCVMALREAAAAGEPGTAEAHARGVKYLVEQGEARRDAGAILYNTWAHTYGLQALAIELRANPTPEIRRAALWQLDRLRRYETYLGGWNYYDFNAQTQRPSLDPTSFGTSAGVIALDEARRAGLPIPDGMIDRCIRRIEDCRAPDGAYFYGTDGRWMPAHPFNQIKGSIGRMQSCNDALWLLGSKRVGQAEAVEGLQLFCDNHDWIAMGRKRPYPHESWYFTAGYYYYFGHFHAARLIERMTDPRRGEFARKLSEFVLPYQESDGSWWDYAMWDYHKPYGTAFSVMTLLRCRAAM